MTEDEYIHKYKNLFTEQTETFTHYLKVFHKQYFYTTQQRLPHYGLAELLRFLKAFDNQQTLQNDSIFMQMLYHPEKNPIISVSSLNNLIFNQSFSCCYLYSNHLIADQKNILGILNFLIPTNSLQLTIENLFEILETWKQILTSKSPCVLFWQNSAGWIHLQPFDNEQAMNQRIIEDSSVA